MNRFCFLLLACCYQVSIVTAADGVGGSPRDLLTYFGRGGNERLLSVIALSDGSVLVGGGADSLAGLPAKTEVIELKGWENDKSESTKRAFLLHCSADLKQLLRVYTLPANTADDIRCIKTTNLPGAKTAAIVISGKFAGHAADKRKPGYFIAPLAGNGIERPITGLAWVKVISAAGTIADDQPWDVGSDGKIVYAEGEPHGYNWVGIRRLTPRGEPDVVPDWRLHYVENNGERKEWFGTPASAVPAGKVTDSLIALKVWGRGDFRSWTDADYNAETADGNGGTKRGRWPYDLFFAGPFNPEQPDKSPRGRGYTGYGWPGTPCGNVGAIVIDRRTNHIYIGGNNKSTLPKGPDFEPYVIAMTETGKQKWWMRLYREVPPKPGESALENQDARLSTPDQYVDGIAIDYTQPEDKEGALVVLARCHGNNRINFWNGHEIKHPKNPGTSFQPQFTGTNGNIHYGWLGRMTLREGTMLHATFVGEYTDKTKFGNKSWTDPNLDDWPMFTAGWPDINTTRCRPTIQVDATGNVYLLGTGRRPITTRNALQKMPKPNEGESRWCDFVRVYSQDLTTLRYSSIIAGTWDWNDKTGGCGVSLSGVYPQEKGLLIAGHSVVDAKTGTAGPTEIPVRNVPSWGAAEKQGVTGILGSLHWE